MKADSTKYELSWIISLCRSGWTGVTEENMMIELNVKRHRWLNSNKALSLYRVTVGMEIYLHFRRMMKLGSSLRNIVPEEDGYINIAWFLYEFIALNIPMKHVHAPGKCNKGMVGKLSKHLRISADDEDDDDIAVELPEGDISEGPQEIDPRWNELKKILDNN